jgi:hypothetical protein
MYNFKAARLVQASKLPMYDLGYTLFIESVAVPEIFV